jgi:hypothetical protein
MLNSLDMINLPTAEPSFAHTEYLAAENDGASLTFWTETVSVAVAVDGASSTTLEKIKN